MKLFAACLLLLAAGAAFADDATVLPQGVVRLRVIPSFTTVDKAYDTDGNAEKASPSYRVFSLNSALEFGLTDALTLGLKWAPGYKLASWVDNVPSGLSSNKKLSLNGPEDLEIGTKVLVLGKTGFVKSDQFRVAFTPGVSLPLDSYDAKDEFAHFASGKTYRPQSASAHGAAGLGLRSDFDWVITPVFSVNLHNQIVQYLPREQVEFETYLKNAGAAAKYNQATADSVYPLTKTKTEWGLTYTIEVEPKAEFDLGNDASLTLGLPVTYESHLKDKVTYNGTKTTPDPDSVLTLKPGVDLFIFLGPLPVEVKVDYAQAVAGKDAGVAGTLAAHLMAYYKFY